MVGDRWGEGLTLANLGETLTKLGQLKGLTNEFAGI
jgi:hypothetical protein